VLDMTNIIEFKYLADQYRTLRNRIDYYEFKKYDKKKLDKAEDEIFKVIFKIDALRRSANIDQNVIMEEVGYDCNHQ
jgi:hypothetical protein